MGYFPRICWYMYNKSCLSTVKCGRLGVCEQYLGVTGCTTGTLFLSWWRHQLKIFSALMALCAGIPRSPGNSPNEVQRDGALMFSLICARTEGWVNNWDAGDLRRHCAHYDVTVKFWSTVNSLFLWRQCNEHIIYTLFLWKQCHDDVIKWKHFPRYWPFVRGIHRSPVKSQHKGQWRGALMFSLICVWINGWVNTREAGDLRRCHAHYDVTVTHWVSPLYGLLPTIHTIHRAYV